jgi:hypothetical protein
VFEEEKRQRNKEEERRQHPERFWYGGEITQAAFDEDYGHKKDERAVIWSCPMCGTPEERDAKVVGWIRDYVCEDTIEEIIRAINERKFKGEERDGNGNYEHEPDGEGNYSEKQLTEDISNTEHAYFLSEHARNDDYEYKGEETILDE